MIANGANEIRPPYAIKRIKNAMKNWLYLDNHNARYLHVLKLKIARMCTISLTAILASNRIGASLSASIHRQAE